MTFGVAENKPDGGVSFRSEEIEGESSHREAEARDHMVGAIHKPSQPVPIAAVHHGVEYAIAQKEIFLPVAGSIRPHGIAVGEKIRPVHATKIGLQKRSRQGPRKQHGHVLDE